MAINQASVAKMIDWLTASPAPRTRFAGASASVGT